MKVRLLALSLVGVSALSFAGNSLRSEIEAENRTINATMKNKDIAAFKKAVAGHIAPGFKYSEDGKNWMSFDQMVSTMGQGFSMYSKITKVESKVLWVKESGNSGSSSENDLMEGIMNGPDKRTHKAVFAGTATDTYKKINGKWMMATMIMKTTKMTMDGKPMPMGK
jgi:hypothetical protein